MNVGMLQTPLKRPLREGQESYNNENKIILWLTSKIIVIIKKKLKSIIELSYIEQINNISIIYYL